MMEEIRCEIPKEIGGFKVSQFRDYRENRIVDCITGKETKTGLPTSNVLYFELEGETWCCIRPSGTEPKIKFYIGVKDETEREASQRLDKMMEAVKKLAQ